MDLNFTKATKSNYYCASVPLREVLFCEISINTLQIRPKGYKIKKLVIKIISLDRIGGNIEKINIHFNCI